jgi:uncharacterized protein YjcR
MTIRPGDKLRAGIRKVRPEDVKNDYIKGLIYLELRLKYSISHSTVARYLKEAGLTIDDQVDHLRHRGGDL